MEKEEKDNNMKKEKDPHKEKDEVKLNTNNKKGETIIIEKQNINKNINFLLKKKEEIIKCNIKEIKDFNISHNKQNKNEIKEEEQSVEINEKKKKRMLLLKIMTY